MPCNGQDNRDNAWAHDDCQELEQPRQVYADSHDDEGYRYEKDCAADDHCVAE